MEIENKFYPIKGFEETYLINPITEEVYSIIKGKKIKGSFHKEKNGGYKGFILKTKDYKKVKWKSLHRIIAETFLPNPNNYPVVNHINGNKLDNSIDNLEWCTISHNNKEAYRLGLRKVSLKTIEQFKRDCLKPKNIEIAIKNLREAKAKAIERAKKVNSKKVCIYNDTFYKEFESEVQACNYLGVHKGSVGRVAKNQNWKVKGYFAKYI